MTSRAATIAYADCVAWVKDSMVKITFARHFVKLVPTCLNSINEINILLHEFISKRIEDGLTLGHKEEHDHIRTV